MSGYSFGFGSGNQGPAVQALIAIGAAWVVIFLVRLCLAPSRLHAQAETRIRELEAEMAKSPLEILFDAKNPGNRFCSSECKQSAHAPADFEHYHECRVEIRNSSSRRTVKNVRVVIEHIGIMPRRPMAMPFDSTQSDLHDLHPQCSALAPVARWPHPKIRPGALAGASAEAYGPIAVSVSGDDVLPARKVFKFDWQRDVMIYEG